MANCKSCGNSSCGGNCTKKCVKVYRPVVWRDGQTGIPGEDGAPGNGIVNIVDNMDGTFTIFMTDGSTYIITMPAPTGKHVVAINPVPGDDNEWELVYDDLSTLVIPAAYYIINQGTGEELIYNQGGHPTRIRSLDEADNNSKIVVSTSGDRVLFDVKQYGRHDALTFSDRSGVGTYVTINQARYQNASGGMSFVTKTGGGPPIDNHNTNEFDLNLTYIDAYKSLMYFRILHTFDFGYNDTSYQLSTDKKFYFELPVSLVEGGIGFPVGFFDGPSQQIFHGGHATCFYDLYEQAVDIESNKIRRYGEKKICDVYYGPQGGGSDPGWPTHPAGNRMTFRFPYIDRLVDPQGGADIQKTYKFEAIGSMIIHHQSNTDYLSTILQDKNH